MRRARCPKEEWPPLTCNLWRRTGNIANRTTAYSMRANTEMSSGNREARTTEADMAAFMESTDVRLGRPRVNRPRNDIIAALSPLSGVDLRARGAVVRNEGIENEQARSECPDRIRGRGRRQRLHHRRQRKQRQERQYRRLDRLRIWRKRPSEQQERGGEGATGARFVGFRAWRNLVASCISTTCQRR